MSTETRTSRDLRGKATNPKRLQNLLRYQHLLGPVSIRSRGERNADRIADSLLQQDRERRRRGNRSFVAHPGFGQAQVQCVIALLSQQAVNFDEILDTRDLRAENDVV